MPGPSRSCRPRGATAALGMTFRATCTYESTKPYTRVWGTGGGVPRNLTALWWMCVLKCEKRGSL